MRVVDGLFGSSLMNGGVSGADLSARLRRAGRAAADAARLAAKRAGRNRGFLAEAPSEAEPVAEE